MGKPYTPWSELKWPWYTGLVLLGTYILGVCWSDCVEGVMAEIGTETGLDLRRETQALVWSARFCGVVLYMRWSEFVGVPLEQSQTATTPLGESKSYLEEGGHHG